MECPDCNENLVIRDATLLPPDQVEKYSSVVKAFCGKCKEDKKIVKGYNSLTDWLAERLSR